MPRLSRSTFSRPKSAAPHSASSTNYAASLNNLAGLYEATGRYAEAEPLYQQAAEIRRNILGEQHRDYAQSLNNLAGLYQTTRRYTEAEPLYSQAIDIVRASLGTEHPTYARSQRSGGSVSSYPALYEGRGAVWPGSQDPALGARAAAPRLCTKHRCSLTALYRTIRQYAKAEALYRHMIKIRSETPGTQHPEYAACLDNLATLYEATRHYTKAEALYGQAAKIRRGARGATPRLCS